MKDATDNEYTLFANIEILFGNTQSTITTTNLFEFEFPYGFTNLTLNKFNFIVLKRTGVYEGSTFYVDRHGNAYSPVMPNSTIVRTRTTHIFNEEFAPASKILFDLEHFSSEPFVQAKIQEFKDIYKQVSVKLNRNKS